MQYSNSMWLEVSMVKRVFSHLGTYRSLPRSALDSVQFVFLEIHLYIIACSPAKLRLNPKFFRSNRMCGKLSCWLYSIMSAFPKKGNRISTLRSPESTGIHLLLRIEVDGGIFRKLHWRNKYWCGVSSNKLEEAERGEIIWQQNINGPIVKLLSKSS